eukprot:2071564-Amphidinium_carterae.1
MMQLSHVAHMLGTLWDSFIDDSPCCGRLRARAVGAPVLACLSLVQRNCRKFGMECVASPWAFVRSSRKIRTWLHCLRSADFALLVLSSTCRPGFLSAMLLAVAVLDGAACQQSQGLRCPSKAPKLLLILCCPLYSRRNLEL